MATSFLVKQIPLSDLTALNYPKAATLVRSWGTLVDSISTAIAAIQNVGQANLMVADFPSGGCIAMAGFTPSWAAKPRKSDGVSSILWLGCTWNDNTSKHYRMAFDIKTNGLTYGNGEINFPSLSEDPIFAVLLDRSLPIPKNLVSYLVGNTFYYGAPDDWAGTVTLAKEVLDGGIQFPTSPIPQEPPPPKKVSGRLFLTSYNCKPEGCVGINPSAFYLSSKICPLPTPLTSSLDCLYPLFQAQQQINGRDSYESFMGQQLVW